MLYVYIGIGGFLGSVSRYAVGNLTRNDWTGSFPVGTFMVNFAGSFLIGFLMTLFLERLVIHPHARIGITTGFLGGLTTFSTYNYEALTLLSRGLWGTALLYVVLSVLAGILAAWSGIVAAQAIPTFLPRKRRQL